MLLHLEFTLYFSTIFVDSFNIRASRETLPTEVRGPEIIPKRGKLMRSFYFDKTQYIGLYFQLQT